MARELTVALVQMQPKLGSVEDNLNKMVELITKIATKERVDLVVFPELVTSGTELGLRFTEMAQRVPGMVVNMLSQRAQDFGVYIAFGIAKAKGKGQRAMCNEQRQSLMVVETRFIASKLPLASPKQSRNFVQ